MGMFQDVMQRCGDIRRGGSAALDLAYVAASRLDGFWEIGLKEWDIAAGALMIQEAGGMVSDFTGADRHLSTGNVVAGSPKLFRDLMRTLHPHLTPALRG
jgi:myo-inositol-1(or 4)-monophosphatase